MTAAGFNRRQRSSFIARARRELGGRSIAELVDAGSADDLQAAFGVVVRRVGDLVSANVLQVGVDDDC